jgi:hypothetical protein
MNEDLVAARHGGVGTRVDGQDDALRPELFGSGAQQVGVLHSGRIE